MTTTNDQDRRVILNGWALKDGALDHVAVIQLQAFSKSDEAVKGIRALADAFGKVISKYDLKPLRVAHEGDFATISFVFLADRIPVHIESPYYGRSTATKKAELIDESIGARPAYFADALMFGESDAYVRVIDGSIDLVGKWDKLSPATTRRGEVSEWPYLIASDIGRDLSAAANRLRDEGAFEWRNEREMLAREQERISRRGSAVPTVAELEAYWTEHASPMQKSKLAEHRVGVMLDFHTRHTGGDKTAGLSPAARRAAEYAQREQPSVPHSLREPVLVAQRG